MTETTARLGLPFLFSNQSQKEITHNEALLRLDVMVQTAVESADLSVPPVSPVEGQLWVVAAAASGDWAGQDGSLAQWRDGAWVFFVPVEGQVVWAQDRAVVGRNVSGSWQWGGGAIADPAAGAVIDVEARAALATLLAACRTYGLIEH